MPEHSDQLKKLSFAGVVISLGIVFGDIGTSPLYVLKAILSASSHIDELLVIGSLSCIIWTLTLQTTVKYVLITLRAENKGEGGIFSLFALLRQKRSWLFVFAIIGGSALLADGVITPSITVMSAIEGLALVNHKIPVIPIVLLIISGMFFIQKSGTSFIGKSFGPIMFLWFSLLGILGFSQLIHNPAVLKAFNPYYVVLLLSKYPQGFLLLGAVFLCTTGAEALYADLGHCGLKNIRISWIFVKTMLIINYLGQGAWVLANSESLAPGTNPFYAIIPHWFLPFGIGMATMAAVIASQALISGSYTLISEAVSLNFWPRIRVKYPSHSKGQMYIPSINWMLFVSCCLVVLLFQNSSNMEAAYGLSITITMLMTTILVFFFLRKKKVSLIWVILFASVYLLIEGAFLIANMFKFSHGGWFTILVASILSSIMLVMYQGRKVRNRYITFHHIKPYLPIISGLSEDKTVPQYAGNLVYITRANYLSDIEEKTIHSIINREPKRADMYWFLHVDIVNSPYMLEYKVTELWPGKIMRIDFYTGFKVEPKINEYFKQVLKHLSDEGKIDLISRHPSLKSHNILSDFRVVHIDRRVAKQIDLAFFDRISINLYYILKRIGISDVNAFGLDAGMVTVERIPLTIPGKSKIPLIIKRE
ncbi:MAG: potassium transporter Kup [Bacteroidetes bacterium GWF2_42_66]|nr:MAG: potassium transporter Kup [Bacteroidetes bacterium GWA2_42_15]OFY03115.1 MAG: potassium transporter Kup [Bacteroidetes bacterium GWE2_42_39]OFY45223.1 MAG: potassium transporter Kup [Bacteroidetes bacterium GWF2_42_66]HBL74118.1 potassium transporter Kup [Prolixibacteraceae bacterium]HCU63694.1 potassium transporter Kup [Prolixibacteraceae bacterium]